MYLFYYHRKVLIKKIYMYKYMYKYIYLLYTKYFDFIIYNSIIYIVDNFIFFISSFKITLILIDDETSKSNQPFFTRLTILFVFSEFIYKIGRSP